MGMYESEAAAAAALDAAADAQERAEEAAMLEAGAPRRRMKRFRHKSFAARLASVEVDVYRRLGPVSDSPSAGAESFLQEGLAQWDELDVSAAYKELADQLAPLVRSLPSVVHHSDQIAAALLARVAPQAPQEDTELHAAGGAQEAALNLLSMLARDLQGEFTKHVPQMLEAVARLVAERRGRVAEAAADPRAVEEAFTAVSFVFKYLRRWLVRDLCGVLAAAQPLRHHPRVELRMFAAGALAFLLRSAPTEQLQAALLMLRGECAAGDELEADAAGALLSESIVGVSMGLHSRAPAMTRVMLAEDVIGQGDAGVAMAVATQRALGRLRVTPAAGAPLWATVLEAASAALADADSEETYAAACVDLASCALEFNHGVRCADLAPYLKLSDAAFACAAAGGEMMQLAAARLARACLGATQAAAPATPALVACAHAASRWQKPLLRCGPAALEQVAVAVLALEGPALRSAGPLAVEAVSRLIELKAPSAEYALLALTEVMHRENALEAAGLPAAAAKRVESALEAFCASPDEALGGDAAPRAAPAWAALRALPLLTRRVGSTTAKERGRLAKLVERVATALPALHADPSAGLLLQTAYDAVGQAAEDVGLEARTRSAMAAELVDLAFSRPECPFTFELAANAASAAGGRAASQSLAAVTTLEKFKARLEAVLPNLRSGCGPLRRATLRVLCEFEQPDADSDGGNPTLLEDWLEVLGSPLTPTNARQRTPNVSRTQLRLNSGRLPASLSGAAAALLLGALRQRYSPMWATIGTAYEALLEKRPSVGWGALLTELEAAQDELVSEGVVGEVIAADDEEAEKGGAGEIGEGRIELIGDTALDAADGDGDASELQLVTAGEEAGLQSTAFEAAGDMYSRLQIDGSHGGDLDAAVAGSRHVTQLLKIVGASAPSMTDGKVGPRIPKLFLSFTIGETEGQGKGVPQLRSYSARGWRECLAEWLRVVGGLRRLRKADCAPRVYATLEELLLDGETKIQELTLAAMGRFEVPYLKPYATSLGKMLHPVTIREELVRFSLEAEARGGAIADTDRAQFLVLLVRAMWPRLKQGGRGAGKKKSARSARPAVLTAFGSLSTAELLPVVVLLLRPFAPALVQTGLNVDQGGLPPGALGVCWSVGLEDAGDTFASVLGNTELISAVHPKRLLGSLGLMTTLLESLSMSLAPYTFALMAVVTRCYVELAALGGGGPTMRAARATCLRLVALVARKQPQLLTQSLLHPLLRAAEAAIMRMSVDAAAAAAERSLCPPVIELALALASDESLAQYLAVGAVPGLGAGILSQLVRCLVLPAVGVDTAGAASATTSAINAARSRDFIEGEALSVLEALLEHGNGELGAELLEPVLDELLPKLRKRLDAAVESAASPRGNRGGDVSCERELAVLAALAARMPEEHAAATACVAVPLLKAAGRNARAASSSTTREALRVVAAACARSAAHGAQGGDDSSAGRNILREVMPPMCRLLALMSDRNGRIALAAALEGAARLPAAGADQRQAAELLTKLNSWDEASLTDEPDYDARIGAFRSMNTALFASLQPAAVLPLAHQACYDLSSDDTALRTSASAALGELVKAAGAETCEVDGGVAAEVEGDTPGGAEATGSVAPDASLRTVMLAAVFPAATDAVRRGALLARDEFLSLLRACALELSYAPFSQLRALLSADPEVDFFLNATHVQRHRRIRALKRLATVLKSQAAREAAGEAEGEDAMVTDTVGASDAPPFTQGVLAGLWAPMLSRILADGQGGADGNLNAAAVSALSAVCACMHWSRFHALLTRLVRGAKAGRRRDAAQVGAVATLVSAYPLASPPCGTPRGTIAAALTRSVLPGLTKLVIDESRDGVVRAPVLLAVVRVVQALPEESDRLAHVSSAAIQTASNALASHNPDVRESARKAMCAVANVLGTAQLPSLIAALCNSLRKGYQLHVLGYTLHAMLSGVAENAAPGELDRSVDSLVPILSEDIMGIAAEERGVGKIAAKGKEAKKCCSYDSLSILARRVQFRADGETVTALIGAVEQLTPRCTSPRVRERVAEMLRALTRGFMANVSATPRELLLLVHTLLDTHAPGTTATAPREQHKLAVAAQAKGKAKAKGTKPSGEAIMADFALQMLLLFLKHGIGARGAKQGQVAETAVAQEGDQAEQGSKQKHAGVSGGDPSRLELLAPFVPVLARCMREHSTAVVTTALKCLAILCRYPLPNLRRHTDELARRSLSLLRSGVNASSPLSQECIKLLTSLLHSNAGWEATNGQLRALIESSFTDLEESNTQATTFRLLRVVLARRIVLDSVYTVMGRVQELLVRSQHASVRQACHGALVQFLLEYPLGPKRLRQHVEFLLVNLTFEHPTGRVAAARALEGLLAQLPEELLDEMAPALLPSLAQRLTEDADAAARQAAAAALRAMLVRCGESGRGVVSSALRSLVGNDDARLRCVGLQVLNLAADAAPALFAANAAATIDALRRALVPIEEEAAARVLSAATQGGELGGRWREAYVSLSAVEKLVTKTGAQMASAPGEALWTAACSPALLLHEHTWVRSAAARVLGLRLRSTSWVAPLARLRALTDAQVRALAADTEGATLAEQAVRNLIALARCLAEVSEEDGAALGADMSDDADGEEQEPVEGADDEGAATLGTDGDGAALGWMLARVARLSAQGGDLQARYALEAVAGVAASVAGERLVPHARVLLRPVMRGKAIARAAAQREADAVAKRRFRKMGQKRSLHVFEEAEEEAFRAAEAEAMKAEGDILRSVGALASEVEALLSDVLGTEAFVDGVTALKKAKKAKEDERKRKRAVGALLDPQADARRKLRRAEKRKVARKRKIEDYKEQRGK